MESLLEDIGRLAIFREDERLGLSIAIGTGFASSGSNGKPRRIGSYG